MHVAILCMHSCLNTKHIVVKQWHFSFSFFSKFSFILHSGRQFICQGSQSSGSLCPLCLIILTAALLAIRETASHMNLASVHLWGPDKPLFTIAPMILRFSFQLLFDKYINYDPGMTVQSDCQAPSYAPPPHTLLISSLRFLKLSARRLGPLITTWPILGIISCVL